MVKNYYKILNIDISSDIRAIKKAYRELAMLYHPDKNKKEGAQAKFVEITEAYEVLRDSIKRSEYDLLYKKSFIEIDDFSFQDEKVRDKQNEWVKFGQKSSKQYSEMGFDKFVKEVFDEIEVTTAVSANIITILLLLGTIVLFFSILPKAFAENPSTGLFTLVLLGGLFFLIYHLYKVMATDRQELKKRQKGKK